jgi:uncharacterized membrane protein HdeD (DUF308 family)
MSDPQNIPPDPAGSPGGFPGSGQPAGSSSPGQGSAARPGQVPGQGGTSGSAPGDAGSAGDKPASGRFAGGGRSAGPTGAGAEQSQYGVATQERLVAGTSSVPAQRENFSAAGTQDEAGYGVAEPRGGMTSKMLKLGWVPVLLAGLGMIAVGIILLVWPKASLSVVAILIGAALVVSGVMRLWEGFTAHSDTGGMRAASIIVGLFAIVAGLYCLRHHSLTLFLVAFVIGVYWVVHGIAELAVAFTPGVGGRGLRAVIGLFSIAAGIILIVWPSISVVLLLTITAAWLLFYGVVLAGLSLQLRKLTAASSRSELDTAQGRLAT